MGSDDFILNSNQTVIAATASEERKVVSNAPPRRMRSLLWYWAPALAWLGAIAYFSTSEFSAANTGELLLHVLRALHIKLSGRDFQLLHFLIRKSAHFVVYAILSGLFFRAWRGPNHLRNWQWQWVLLALAVCMVASSFDEIHQFFTPGRTGIAKDVILDMSGALFMQLLIVTAMTNSRLRSLT